MLPFRPILAALLTLMPWLPLPVQAGDRLVVYSERREHLIEPIFEAYTRATGVEVRFITEQAGVLIERLVAEGARSPADLLMAVDAGNLWLATQRGVLRPTQSQRLEQAVPEYLRDPEGHWYGLSVRARTIFYAPSRVDPAELAGYAELADPRWRGRLCLRSSRKVYNQSLVAMMIKRLGEAETEAIVRGWVANLATAPFADDTLLLRAIAAGQCDLGLANTYYFGRLQREDPAIDVRPHWPAAEHGGVHVNIAGAGVVRHSRNPEAAQRFLEWLAGPEAQRDFAGLNLEYPVNRSVPVDPLVASWGEFSPDLINVSEAGRLQADAVRLMDRAGWR